DDISKPDTHEAAEGFFGSLADDDLGNALSRAHYADWINRLVGRDENERLRVEFNCRPNGVFSTQHVVDDSFANVLFHQRHMFVSSRMKDGVGTQFCEHILETLAILNVCNDADKSAVRKSGAEFRGDCENTVFAMTKQHHTARLIRYDLATEFRADRAAGASYHNRSATDGLLQAVFLSEQGLVTQQRLN